MAIQRRSLFGFPPPSQPQSVVTSRLIPLTPGVTENQPWPGRAPGSADSMTNFVPMDGCLVPRSRLSSLNTIRTINGSITAIGVVNYGNPINSPRAWLASTRSFGLLCSGGSISLASYTSAFGMGLSFMTASNANWWNFAQVYAADLGDNMLVAAGPDSTGGSNTSLIALYQASPTVSPKCSFLTGAPRAAAVGAFDNYLVAYNVNGFMNRVQWCVRGEPSNWTGEGSGFEDLLEMRGIGAAVMPSPDGRVYLLSNEEIWYGVRAAYPAQFNFFPLEPDVGVRDAATIQRTEKGFFFLGNDKALRFLPYGGGGSQVVSPSFAAMLRYVIAADYTAGQVSGVYDAATKTYYLHYAHSGTVRGALINVETGEWGFQTLPVTASGAAGQVVYSGEYTNTSRIVLFGSSNGTVYSLNSTLGTDSGSTVTSTWQSAVIAAELPANYKQVVEVALDYRTTSPSTVSLKVSVDGGNNYEATARPLSLASAPFGNRVVAQTYLGGAFPTVQLDSTGTGLELHRLEVTMQIGGRR